MKIGAIVLAAGEGKRFKGNKLLATLKGKSIITYALESINNLDRVVIAGRYAKELIDHLKNEIIIYNPSWNKGVSSSIKLGIRFFQDYDGVLVVLGDMPLVTKNDIEKILSRFDNNCEAVIPTYNNLWGNPVLLSNKLFPKLLTLEGDQGAKQILKIEEEKSSSNIYTVECSIGVTLDIDTKEDINKIEKIMVEKR
ncbi:nucleotidyltransferase family protein [Acidianus manzaensis]|uniref:4-diphosphocytidyl-2C-methyl-D-erythritol kinase n=1 Tax=Acidianus manzaensis TaxID=282676 RepID=A0A1W6JXV4_9CREN|nr:nucleotidyltransferase family protein [Acidianus manzaensis]ARM75096.1 4-diphosphocytidyl-2C-methyl-D-erythritol kinase [Acidianus manzaensis]